MVHAKLMKTQIIDDWINPLLFELLVKTINSSDFAWYKSTKVDEVLKSPVKGFSYKKFNQQFCHSFYDYKVGINSTFYEQVLTIAELLNFKTLLRMKANVGLNRNKALVGGWHRDHDDTYNSCNAILYLNTNNGFTLLEDGTKVLSKANRVVIFDNKLLHTDITQTDTDERTVLNICYVPNGL